MTLRFHTAPMSFRGDDKLDVTRGTGGPFGQAFAPSDELLWPLIAKRKRQGLTDADWADFSDRFRAEMRESYRRRRADWEALLGGETATLCCHCPRPERCHRGLLASILVRLGAVYEGEVCG